MTTEDYILDLADRFRRLEASISAIPMYQTPPYDYDDRVPAAENVELISSIATSGATKVALRWTRPANPDIDHFEIWIARTAYSSEQPYQIAATADSPASFTVNTDQDTAAIAYIRTVMKNGLGTDLNASPTVSFNVYKFVATAADIADGAITDQKFDRVSANKVQVRDADIDRLTANKVKIRDADIERITADKLQVVDADIVSLAAAKILAGTIDVLLRLTSPEIDIVDDTLTIHLDKTNRIKVSDTYYDREVQLIPSLAGAIKISSITGPDHYMDVDIAGFQVFANGFMQWQFTYGASGTLVQGWSADGTHSFTISCLDSLQYADIPGELRVNGTKVVGTQQSAITLNSLLTGSTVKVPDLTYDATERDMLNELKNGLNYANTALSDLHTTISNILTALRNHGLIAT